MMSRQNDLENRVSELEMQLSFQENHIDTLNNALIDQQSRIDQLETLLRLYKKRLDEMQHGLLGEDEKGIEVPPHY